MENHEKYISIGRLMEFLEISQSTIYRLLAKGMPSVKVGSVHRFPREQVLNWLTENHTGTPSD